MNQKIQSSNVIDQSRISIVWLHLWSEIENWYGDVQQKESGSELLIRLQDKYALTSNLSKTSMKVVEDPNAFGTGMKLCDCVDHIGKIFCDNSCQPKNQEEEPDKEQLWLPIPNHMPPFGKFVWLYYNSDLGKKTSIASLREIRSSGDGVKSLWYMANREVAIWAEAIAWMPIETPEPPK